MSRGSHPQVPPGAVLTGPAQRMRSMMTELYPICRSITGEGVRETLRVISRTIPIQAVAVESGSQAHDWTVNEEWNIRDAYVADASGHRVIDFRENNLHLMSYSAPVRARMTLDELRPHLFTLPEHPDWIPYRTSYYSRKWGFCLSQRQLDAMDDGPYDVVVDSTLAPGVLNYGELVIPGDSADEILFTAHVCHPSLANDNLSGIAVATELARAISDTPRRRHTFRFLFAPGTIGSITWLSRNTDRLPSLRHGLVLTGLGDRGRLVYKRTRQGSRDVDAAAAHVVRHHGGEVRPYSPYGYDERQFNAIGFDLPVGRLSRTPHGEYPEYHTSADNLEFVDDGQLVDALETLLELVEVLEHDAAFRNLSPYGEPQLGKRGLYPSTGGRSATDAVMAMLWTLAYSDGGTRLLDVAETSGMRFASLWEAADKLLGAGLLEKVRSPAREDE